MAHNTAICLTFIVYMCTENINNKMEDRGKTGSSGDRCYFFPFLFPAPLFGGVMGLLAPGPPAAPYGVPSFLLSEAGFKIWEGRRNVDNLNTFYIQNALTTGTSEISPL